MFNSHASLLALSSSKRSFRVQQWSRKCVPRLPWVHLYYFGIWLISLPNVFLRTEENFYPRNPPKMVVVFKNIKLLQIFAPFSQTNHQSPPRKLKFVSNFKHFGFRRQVFSKRPRNYLRKRQNMTPFWTDNRTLYR